MKNYSKICTFALLAVAFIACNKPAETGQNHQQSELPNTTFAPSSAICDQTSFPQITSFTDYVFEEHLVFAQTDSDSIGHLRQLDIEFPTEMKDKKVLARIQEQLIDTLFNEHYHTAKLDNAVAKYWSISPNKIEHKTTYPHIVPDDSDEYFEYGGVNNIHYEHICGRTSYNKNGLYIMRHHYSWFDGGCHHYPNTSYIAFDTRTGNLVHFLDIFSEQYDDYEQKMTYDIEFYVSEALLKKVPQHLNAVLERRFFYHYA